MVNENLISILDLNILSDLGYPPYKLLNIPEELLQVPLAHNYSKLKKLTFFLLVDTTYVLSNETIFRY
jgi:hypothetical protein